MTDFLFGGMVQANTPINITSALVAANVSVTANSLPTVGLFAPSTNSLGFATNSTQQMVIDTNGNMGIGTATPVNNGGGSQTLTINGAVVGIFQVQANGVNAGQMFSRSANNLTLNAPNANISLETGNTERMRITNAGNISTTGNIAIGNVSGPYNSGTGRAYLTVQGSGVATSTGAGIIQLATNAAGSTNPYPIGNIEWHIPDNTSSTGTRVGFITMGGLGASANNIGSYMHFATKADGVAGVGAVGMMLTGVGNLLIGTTTAPGAGNGNATVVIQGVGTNGGGIELSGGTAGGGNIFALNGAGLAFSTYTGPVGTEVPTERMRIDANGNVGINTTSVPSKIYISQGNTTAYGLISQTQIVGLTAGNYVNMAYFTNTRSTNNDGLRIVNLRDSTGSGIGNWQTESYRIRRSVDQNDGSTGVQEEIVFGQSTLAFNTSGSERLRIDSSGQIGIGTAVPSAFLDVFAATQPSDDLGTIRANVASTNSSSVIVRNSYGWGQFMQWVGTGMRIGSRNTTGGGSGNVNFTYGNDAVGMTMLGSTGNVGIASTTPTQLLDVQGSVNVLNTLVMSNSFLRNVLINGAFNIAQRGTSFTDGNGYTLDRWYGNRNGGVAGVTYSQAYGAFGANKYCLSIQRTAGNSATNPANFYQAIEGQNCRFMAGQTVTLSFQIGTGGTISNTGHSASLNYQTTTTDIGPSGSWTNAGTANFNVVNNTAFTKYSMQFTVPSTATQLEIEFGINFTGTAGADDRYYITEIQLEAGPVPTPFERRMVSTELALCQRYYWINSSATNSVSYYMPVFAFSTTVAYGVIEFPVTMRTTPTISTTGTPANYRIFLGGTAYALTGGPAIDQATPYSSSISFTTAGTLTVGQAGMAGANSSTAAFLGFNAEL